MSNPPLYMIKTLSIEKDVFLKIEHGFSSSKNISPLHVSFPHFFFKYKNTLNKKTYSSLFNIYFFMFHFYHKHTDSLSLCRVVFKNLIYPG